jgi:hypothetical protein
MSMSSATLPLSVCRSSLTEEADALQAKLLPLTKSHGKALVRIDIKGSSITKAGMTEQATFAKQRPSSLTSRCHHLEPVTKHCARTMEAARSDQSPNMALRAVVSWPSSAKRIPRACI